MAAGALGLLPLASRAQQPAPGVVFLLDNHESMQDFPQYLPEDFTPGYYPSPESSAPGDLGGDGRAGYNLNSSSSPMLQSIALAGKGRSYRVDQPGALRGALSAALGRIRAQASSEP